MHVTPEGEKTIEVFHLNDNSERPEQIEDRKTLYQKYLLELKKIKCAEAILNTPELPQDVYNMAHESLLSSSKSLELLTALNEPFSGMLIAQKQ